MYGSAYSSQTGTYSQTISSDPVVYELTDFTNYTSHMSVGVGSSDNTWFNVSQWERVGGAVVSWLVPCPPGSNQDCYPQSIAVGPNTNGTRIGDPWVLGVNQIGDDYGIWHWENSTWVAKPGTATQIAISPQGVPWIINHLGEISYWNGSAFQLAPGNGCAIAIGVGPATGADPRGVPWVIGCDGWDNVNGSIYKLQASTWVKQPDYRRLLRARYDEQKPTSDCDILGEVDQLAHKSRRSGREPKSVRNERRRHQKQKMGSSG